MSKYLLEIADDQLSIIDRIRVSLHCSDMAQFFNKAINLAMLVADVRENGQTIVIEKDGKKLKRIVFD